MKTRTTEQDLRRIFSIVPLIYYQQGLTLTELQKKAGYASEKELYKSIERLMMFGIPPFSPADFISVHIDESQRVWLDFPLGLEYPLALSSEEWTFIQKLIRKELQVVKQDDLAVLPLRNVLGRLSEVPIDFEADDLVGFQRNLIEEAMQDKLQIEVSYLSLSAKQGELRRLEPWLLFTHSDITYLLAYCYTRQAARCFRLERMQDLQILEEKQQHPIPEDLAEYLSSSSLFQKELHGFQAKVAFAPELLAKLRCLLRLSHIQPWRQSRYGLSYSSWLSASCKVQDSIWLRGVLRSLGASVILLAPAHLRQSYCQELDEIAVPELISRLPKDTR